MQSSQHQRARPGARVLAFVAGSVLVHAALFAWGPQDLLNAPSGPGVVPHQRVRVVAGAELARAREQARAIASRRDNTERKRPQAPTAEPKREDQAKPPEDKLAGQVVDIPPSADSRPPDDAKYLAEHNARAERETVSRHQSADYKNAMNERTVARPAQERVEAPPHDALAIDLGPEKPGRDARDAKPALGNQPVLELPRLTQRDRLQLAFDEELGVLKNQVETEAIPGQGERLRLSLGDPDAEAAQQAGSSPSPSMSFQDLVPQVGVLARVTGAPSNDYLDGLEEGEGTFLNAREFKYASFFNRLKRGVSQHWRPFVEYRRRDPTGNVYGPRARRTVVTVTLNSDGTLKDAAVAESSGLDFLDREAVAALKRAGPYPNPPRGLVGDAGLITFPFSFNIDPSPDGAWSPF